MLIALLNDSRVRVLSSYFLTADIIIAQILTHSGKLMLTLDVNILQNDCSLSALLAKCVRTL